MIREWLERVVPDPVMRDRARTLLMIPPHVVKLLVGVARDPRVPPRAKVFAAAAAAYALSPVDLVPDAIPIIGRTDDIVIVALALDHLIEQAGSSVIREHWDGPDEVLAVLVDLVGLIAGLVPRPLRIAIHAYLRG